MVQKMFFGTLIAIVLVTVDQSKAAAVSETACTAAGTECAVVPNSECDTDPNILKCKCSDDYKEDLKDKSTCVAKVIAGNVCTNDDAGNTKCEGVDSNAVCSAAKCACTADYSLSSDGTKCEQKITTVVCTPGTAGTAICEQVDSNSECPTGGDKCACKEGYSGTVSCEKDAGSSATSAWMTTSLIVTSLLVCLPRLIFGIKG